MDKAGINQEVIAAAEELIANLPDGEYVGLGRLRIAIRATKGLNAAITSLRNPMYCDGCDGTGLMEGWNRRDGNSCPKCKGTAILND